MIENVGIQSVDDDLRSPKFLSDGQTLIVGSVEQALVTVWDCSTALKPKFAFSSGLKKLFDLDIHPDGNAIVVAGLPMNDDVPLSLWSLKDQQLLKEFSSSPYLLPGGYFLSTAFTLDGRFIVVGHSLVYSSENRQVEAELEGPHEWYYGVAMHPSGKYMAIPGHSGGVADLEFYDVGGQWREQEEWKIQFNWDTLFTSFCPDGRYFVITGRKLHLYKFSEQIKVDLETYKQNTSPESWEGNWSKSVFTPDSKILISGSNEGFIYFWEVATGKLISAHPAHQDWISSLAINQSGTLLVSTSADRTLKLWSLSQ